MADDELSEYICRACGNDYTTQGWLDRHIESKHSVGKSDEEPESAAPEEEWVWTPESGADKPIPPEPEPEIPDTPCSNHANRESVWTSDGAKTSVVHYCQQCKEKYT